MKYLHHLLLVFAFLFLCTGSSVAQEVDDEVINEKITSFIAKLKGLQLPNGSWKYGSKKYNIGLTSLIVVALRTAKLPEDHPMIRKAMAYLLKEGHTDFSYTVGLYAMAMEHADAKKYRGALQNATNWILRSQSKGTWDYSGKGPGDNSITQFCILGLKSARDGGLDVPDSAFAATERHFRRTQNADGGWGYIPKRNSTNTMTPAALSSLHVCGVEFEKSLELINGPRSIGRYEQEKVVKSGLEYLAKNMKSILSNGYGAYGLERVGVFYDQRFLNGVDWYEAGAKLVVRASASDAYYTSLYLLFLAKGDTPLAINKAKWGKGREWNLRHSDARNMTKLLSRNFKTKMDWQMVELKPENKDVGKAPLLYLSGYRKFRPSKLELKTIKGFLDEKGSVLFAPNLRSSKFRTDVEKYLSYLYPRARFVPLPKHHDLRRMYHNLQNARLPIRVLKTNCEYKKIFLATKDISLEFEAKKPSAMSRQILDNLIRFAMLEKPLVGRLKNVKLKIPQKIEIKKEDFTKALGVDDAGIDVAQMIYNKDPIIRNPEAVSNALGFMRHSLKIPTRQFPSLLRFEDPEIHDKPLLYMTGFAEFTLSETAKINLKKYLANGGFLFADSGCSCEEFIESYTRLMKELYPGKKIEKVTAKHPLYNEPFQVEPRFSELLRRKAKLQNNYLRGIKVNGRYVMLLSDYDIVSSLMNSLGEDSKGLKAPESFKLFTNLVNYGLTY